MIKYVIGYKGDRLRHFKSDTLDHDKLARDNGIDSCSGDLIERGLIIEGKPLILDCASASHKAKHEFNKLLFDPSILRAREAETLYAYGSFLKEGD